MRFAAVLGVGLALMAGAAGADPLRTSPLPKARPEVETLRAATLVVVPVFYDADIRPRPRPDRASRRQLQPAVSAGSTLARAQLPAEGMRRSPVPRARPERAIARSERPVSPEPARVLQSGRVGPICGSREIVGQTVDRIPGRLRGCGIDAPVRVAEVGGVRLSRATTMECETARALHSWVERGVKPGIGRLGGGPARLEIAAGYACRTINHRPGGSISEHGKGKAVDISGITLRNGTTISVEDGWGRRVEGQVLRRLHRSACGPFGTVLGPDADRFHQDHFHFDTKARRSPYCR
ncbi:MAG: extensin family protein [Paracoccaceae bacterium]|nr:extensin family protein [Paracoccaceae bacterium]